VDGGEGGDLGTARGGRGRGERGGLLAGNGCGVRCESKCPGEVGDDAVFSPGCDELDPEVGWGDKGEMGGEAKFAVRRGDLLKRRGATVGPCIALVTKLDGEYEVGVEAREPYGGLESREALDTNPEGGVERGPDLDRDTGERFDRDRRSLSIDLDVDAGGESKEAVDCVPEIAWVGSDEDFDFESIEEDEVGADLVLDEACREPDENGTSSIDKKESSLSHRSSASENVVDAGLDTDAAEYAEDTDIDVVNSWARPLDRS